MLAKIVDDLRYRIGELEDCIDALDRLIEDVEATGLDDTLNKLCESRNRLNLNRIELELHVNKLERHILEFEQDRMLTE